MTDPALLSPVPSTADARRGPEEHRWHFIDALRGVALAGILFVNSLDITQVGTRAAHAAAADPVRDVLYVLVQTRFVPIFTVLFGMSLFFVLSGSRARARGQWLVPLRRLVTLLALGSALAVVYPPNILTEYAIYGLLVLPVVVLAPRGVTLGAGLVLTVAAQLLTGGGNESLTPGLILLGAGTAAWGLPRVLESASTGVRIAAAVCGALVVPALLLQSTTPGDPRFSAWGAHAGLVMAAAYVLGLSVLWSTRGRRVLAAVFSPLGRMALTNYVSAALVVAAVTRFVDFSRIPLVWPTAVLSAAVIVVQVLVGRFWLARFRYGPCEWVWRTATWARPVALRLPSREGATGS